MRIFLLVIVWVSTSFFGCYANNSVNDKSINGLNMNNEFISKNNINYQLLIERIIFCVKNGDFNKSDLMLGKLEILAHKNNNFKKEQGVYFNIPNFPDLQVNLIKNVGDSEWSVIKLHSKNVFYTKFIPNFNDNFFENNSSLNFKKIDFDSRLSNYRYIYSYEGLFDVIFIVKSEQYRKQKHPNNFQAFEIRR